MRPPVCCARARLRARASSRPRANSCGLYLSYLFTRPSALSFIGTDYTADLPPSCQILRPGKLLWSDSGCVSCVCHPVLSFPLSTDEFISLLSKQTSISEFSFFQPPVIDACPVNPGRLGSRGSRPAARSQSVFINPRLSRFSLLHFFISLHLCLRPSLFPFFSPRSLPPRSHDPLR